MTSLNPGTLADTVRKHEQMAAFANGFKEVSTLQTHTWFDIVSKSLEILSAILRFLPSDFFSRLLNNKKVIVKNTSGKRVHIRVRQDGAVDDSSEDLAPGESSTFGLLQNRAYFTIVVLPDDNTKEQPICTNRLWSGGDPLTISPNFTIGKEFEIKKKR